MNTKRLSALVLALLLALQLAACAGTKETPAAVQEPETVTEQIDTQGTETDAQRTSLVFEYQIDRISPEFESTLETLFPVDIIMAENQSTNPYLRLTNELTHGMAPDFVLCEYIKRIEDEVLAEYFYDLGAQSFVNNYYLSAVESCTASDGGLYYIPGPSYVYGIVYDKTLFAELGLTVPKNYSEFVDVIHQVDAMGLTGTEPDPNNPNKTIEVPVRAFVPTVRWCDMSQIMFNTMNYEDTFRGISNNKWLVDYQTGNGTMVGHMEAAAEKWLKLFDDGVLTLDLWTMEPGTRSRKLYDYHTSLMTIESQQAYGFNTQLNAENPDNIHEMGLMPIYTSDEPDSGYLYAIPRSFIGITAQGAADPEKLSAMLQIFDYLSTPEGQKLLISGSDYFGFLKDDTSLGSDFYTEVLDTINAGRIIPTFYFEGDNHGDYVETYMHDTTADLVNGKITVEQWLKGADEYRDKALAPKNTEVYGTVPETLVALQTAYIDGLAYLHSMDADIGYVPVSAYYGTQTYFYSGDITDDMIGLITTANRYYISTIDNDMDPVIVEMTGQELLDLALANGENGMAAFAGVEMVYSLSGENGGQYVSLKINGEDMDMNKTYRVASLRGAVAYNKVVEEHPEMNFRDMFKDYLASFDGVVTAPAQLTIVD